MTPGANRSKQTQIYRLMQQGFDAQQISRRVKVYKDCVEKFMKHFKTAKNLPQTSAFAAIKDGMPSIAGLNRMDSMKQTLSESQAANQALLSRVEALEAKAAPKAALKVSVTEAKDGLG